MSDLHKTVFQEIFDAELLSQWDSIGEIIAETMNVPMVCITYVQNDELHFLISKERRKLPSLKNTSLKLPDPTSFCAEVIKYKNELLIKNAANDKTWKTNKLVAKAGLNSYLGYPLFWPNGDIFGTLCIFDTKEISGFQTHHGLMLHLKNLIEQNLKFLAKSVAMSGEFSRLMTLASVDELTGALNRREFLARVNKEIKDHIKHKKPCSLMMIDIDDFKKINDSHGHLNGDRALSMIGTFLAKHKRSNDILGRLGGEEFAIFMPLTLGKDAYQLATRIQQSLRVNTLKIDDLSTKLTASFGVTEVALEQGLTEALTRADQAMYEAKKRGKNAVVAASELD
ncbi:GGDEF domain-containing protein [Methylophaga sp.]|uniref:GGDEF domain-containing protein n=1 Tax=Methylophaga sp. TaxID=2024840 RepID=UPI003F69B573